MNNTEEGDNMEASGLQRGLEDSDRYELSISNDWDHTTHARLFNTHKYSTNNER